MEISFVFVTLAMLIVWVIRGKEKASRDAARKDEGMCIIVISIFLAFVNV